jgi:large subunit ribosomal protein L29
VLLVTVRRKDEEREMKPAELRAMSKEQLDLTLKDTIKNLFHLCCQSAAERLETPSEIRKAKREVARIKTIQRERELAAEKTGSQGTLKR